MFVILPHLYKLIHIFWFKTTMKQILLLFCFVNSINNKKLPKLNQFPSDFLFGVASSAYQIEGAWNTSGKGENSWDKFTHTHPEKILDHSNGDIACDSYNHWKDDVKLLRELGVDFYRFSLSWSRLLPYGYPHYINPDGLRYYNDLINELVANGIKPMITLYHWDLPVPLEKIGGWTNPLVADIFADYAKIAYTSFGDRVPYWITLNTNCRGYGSDDVPPGLDLNGVADYMCGYVSLLAHAKAYRVYEKYFKQRQKGKVGIVSMDVRWYESLTNNTRDQLATDRARKFTSGWLTDPLIGTGDYPEIMKTRIAYRSLNEGFPRSRLPNLSDKDKTLINGATDFIGLNVYTTNYVSDVPEEPFLFPGYEKDMRAKFSTDSSWPNSSAEWLKVVPTTARKILNWFKDEYNNPEMVITENGFADDGQLEDYGRVNYYKKYLDEILKAVNEDKVNLIAYAAWSLTDNFEWTEGYTQKFGLYHIDFNHPNRTRTKKLSANIYQKYIKHNKAKQRM